MDEQTKANITAAPVSRVEWIEAARLSANDYNPNSVAPPELELLIESIVQDGFTQPIVVDRPSMQIVDGYHRWRVSIDMRVHAIYGGFVPVVFTEFSKEHRVASTVRHNRARGAHGVLKMANLVELLRENGVSNDAIAMNLGMEEEELNSCVARERLTGISP